MKEITRVYAWFFVARVETSTRELNICYNPRVHRVPVQASMAAGCMSSVGL